MSCQAPTFRCHTRSKRDGHAAVIRAITTTEADEAVASPGFLGGGDREREDLTLPVGSCDMWEVFLGSSVAQDLVYSNNDLLVNKIACSGWR